MHMHRRGKDCELSYSSLPLVLWSYTAGTNLSMLLKKKQHFRESETTDQNNNRGQPDLQAVVQWTEPSSPTMEGMVCSFRSTSTSTTMPRQSLNFSPHFRTASQHTMIQNQEQQEWTKQEEAIFDSQTTPGFKKRIRKNIYLLIIKPAIVGHKSLLLYKAQTIRSQIQQQHH